MTSDFNEITDAPLSCGIEFLTDFWREKYMQEYIKNGGSKLKFVTGQRKNPFSASDVFHCCPGTLQDRVVFCKRCVDA